MPGDFAGFISYSRRASGGLAADLQTAVERFAKSWYQLRAVRLFRDDATMSANTALWPTIESALVSAEWLILLTSPAAAASPWVGNEVRWWLEHKSAERILIVLEEGPDLVWDPAAADFDWPGTTNLPPALRGAFPEEPRWIDLRWYELDGGLKRSDPRWSERVADVAAAVRFAERDQLIGENVREHRRARRLLRAGVVGLSLLLVASLVATVIAILQGREADRQADIARTQEHAATEQARIALARQLAAQADALASTDLRTASLLAVQAFRTNDDAQTRATLFQMATTSPQLVRTLPVGSYVSAVAATPGGVVVTGSEDGVVRRWEGAEDTEVIDLAEPVTDLAISDDASVVLALGASTDSPRAVVWSDGQQHDLEGIGDTSAVAVSPDGGRLASAGLDATHVWSLGTEGPRSDGVVEVGGSRLAFGESGLAAFGIAGEWLLVDLEAGTYQTGSHFFPMTAMSMAVAADGNAWAMFHGTRDMDVWRGAATYSDSDANAVAPSDLAESSGIALSADGSRLANVGDGELSVVEVIPRRGEVQRPLRLGGVGAANLDVIAFGGNRHLVTGSGSDALVWDVDQLFRFGRSFPAQLADGCNVCREPTVSVSPAGMQALVVEWDAQGSSVVDLTDGSQWQLPRGDSFVDGATWLDNDTVLAVTGDDQVVVLEPGHESSRTVGTVTSDESDVLTVVGDGDEHGRVTLLRESGTVETVDLASGAVTRSAALAQVLGDGDRPPLAGIAPDQSSAFVSFDGPTSTQLAVVEIATGRVTESAVPDGVAGAAYAEDSRLLVFDGRHVGELGPDGGLADPAPAGVAAQPPVVITRDAAMAVSGGMDGTVHLVDLRRGTEFGSFEVPQEEDSWAVSAFSNEGSRLVTAIQPMQTFGLDSSLRVLSLDPDDWIAAACAVAARDLTVEDWARYGLGDPPADLRCVR